MNIQYYLDSHFKRTVAQKCPTINSQCKSQYRNSNLLNIIQIMVKVDNRGGSGIIRVIRHSSTTLSFLFDTIIFFHAVLERLRESS